MLPIDEGIAFPIKRTGRSKARINVTGTIAKMEYGDSVLLPSWYTRNVMSVMVAWNHMAKKIGAELTWELREEGLRAWRKK